jgi:hypothetical protein
MGSAAKTIPPTAPAQRLSRPPPSHSAARRASVRPPALGRDADTVRARPVTASVIPFPRPAAVPARFPLAAKVPAIAVPEVAVRVAPARADATATSPQRPLSIAAASQPGLTLMILRADGGGTRNIRLTGTALVIATLIAACAVSAALGVGWTIGTFTAGL